MVAVILASVVVVLGLINATSEVDIGVESV